MTLTIDPIIRKIGRFIPAGAGILAIIAVLSSSSSDRPQPYTPDLRSTALVAAAAAAQEAGRPDDAVDLYVSALAVDPRNSDAYVGLGDLANARKTPGAALHYYRSARVLSPSDAAAISGEGAAYAARAELPVPNHQE